jgi:hypothetical protein
MRSYVLGSAAASYDLPPLGGFRGSLELPAASVPANTRLQLASSLHAPPSSPVLAGARRQVQATGTLNVYFYTTIQLSSTVTFATLPGFSIILPPTINPTGLQFFYAISDPQPSNGAKGQFRTEGPATVSGQIVSFAPSNTGLTLQAGQPYTIALYAITAIAAQPTPTPSAASKVYVIVGDSVETYTAAGVRTTPTITQGLNAPGSLAVDAAGKIYVTNLGNNSVTTYTPEGVQTTPTIGGLYRPFAVAVDAAGKIYVSGDYAVTTYTANGARTTPTISGHI